MISLSDINECLSDPCLNGGSCSAIGNEYTCECVDGYTGIHCESGNISIPYKSEQ